MAATFRSAPRSPWIAFARREDLLGLLGNLLDSACKWADGNVHLTIIHHWPTYCVVIDDDGPGTPETRRDVMLSRGARLDEQVPGHGLGLGIVRDIVDAWGAHLELGTSPLGGLQVRIELPEK